MTLETLVWVNNLGRIFLLLAIILWGLYYRKMPKAIQIVGIYLGVNLIVQIAAYFIAKESGNNLPLLHLNTLLEFVFFSLFFKEVYTAQFFFKKYFIYIILGVTLLLILNSVFFESVYAYNTKARVLVQGCLIVYVLIYFFDAFGRVDLTHGINQAISFICFAILLYYAGSLFIFMFGQTIMISNLKEESRIIWFINSLLNMLFQLIVFLAIAKIAFQRKKIVV